MKIIILSDDYLPKSVKNHAKMLHELAKEYLSRGYEVVVLTPGDWSQASKLSIDSVDGVQVWRFRSKPTRGVKKVMRAINESLLSWRAYKAIKEKIREEKFDICINYSPTIFFGILAWIFKKNNAYIYLILRDFFPQWIIDNGMIKKNSLIAIYFRFFEKINYSVSDCVAVQSPANISLFNEVYKNHKNVCVLMNWSKSTPISQKKIALRRELNLEDKIIFFYGGNIGHAQDMMNIMRLCRNLLNYSNVVFLLVGQGDEFELVKGKIDEWNLTNVILKDAVPQDLYREIISEVDVGLFSLSASHTAHNFPGKLLGYMVESLPILGSVNPFNDVIDVINDSKSGFVSVNGEDDLFLANAISLISNASLRNSMGVQSNKLLTTTFSVEKAADEIIKQFSKRNS